MLFMGPSYIFGPTHSDPFEPIRSNWTIWTVRIHLDLCWSYGPFGTRLNHSNPIGVNLDYWNRLDYFGPLEYPRTNSDQTDHFDLFGSGLTRLDPFDPIRAVYIVRTHLDPLNTFGPIWTHLDPFGPIWTHLDLSRPQGPFGTLNHVDPFWPI